MKFLLRTLFLAVIILLIQTTFAQQKQLTIEDYQNRELYPEQIKQLQWLANTDDFSYVKNNCIVKGNIKTEKTDTILRLKELNTALEGSNEKKMENLPTFTWDDNRSIQFNYNNKIFVFNIDSKKLEKKLDLIEKSENQDIETNTLNCAYTIENNLYITYKGENIQVTNDKDKDKDIVNGKSVHRNEFGIDKGTFWSPKGSLLAFYRMDETMVTDYPLVNIDTRIATTKNIKYPMAGMKSHEVTVGVFNPATKQTVFLKTGEPKEQFLTNISWSPDEKYVFIAVLNRDQNHMWLNKYDATTGDFVKTLFEEKSDKWVEPLNGLYFLKTKPDLFIWQSKQDGFNHLYMYNVNGKLIKQLTKGDWEVVDIIGFNNNETELHFVSNEGNPVGKNIYSLNIKTGVRKKLNTVNGTNRALFNNSGKYFIDFCNSLLIPNQIKIMSSEGKEIRTLLVSKNPFKDYKLGKTSVFTIKADDGTELYCRMILPADFDPNKKYPVINYVYGGPHSQMVTDSWLAGAGVFLNYFAVKGYIVFTLDNRGTGMRGQKFEQAIHRKLGDIEVKDQMKGIEYLKSMSYVDKNRIAVHGWSYGGFMTLSMMLKNLGVFKVGVAGGPVIDWKYYEVMYGERYMDTPEQNPEGYKNADVLNYVKDLDGKLLIIHGTMDETVVWQHSLLFIKKCVDERKQVDYFVYPDHEHNVSGKDRLHLFHKIFDYIDGNINKQ